MGITNLFQPTHKKILSKKEDMANLLLRVTTNEMNFDFIKSLRLSEMEFLRFKLCLYAFNLGHLNYFIQKRCNWVQESLQVAGDILLLVINKIILYDSEIDEKFYDLIQDDLKEFLEKKVKKLVNNFDEKYKLNSVSRRRELLKVYLFDEFVSYCEWIELDKDSTVGYSCLIKFTGRYYGDNKKPELFTQNFDNVIRRTSIVIFSDYISKI